MPCNSSPAAGDFALAMAVSLPGTIGFVAEDLLATFRAVPLLDAYDVYQHLMDYWAATMQDDCYLIAGEGWQQAAQPRLIVEFAGEGELVQRCDDPYASLRALVEARGKPPLRFRVEQPSLEQVFLELTGRSLRDE